MRQTPNRGITLSPIVKKASRSWIGPRATRMGSALNVAGHDAAPGHAEAAREDDAGLAPGLDHLFHMGAVAETWDPKKPLDEQLESALAKASPADTRDEPERKARPMPAMVAKRVIA